MRHSLLSRAVSTLRTWVGLNDPMDDRLHASHGWLLPTSESVRAHRATEGVTPDIPPTTRSDVR